VSDPKFPSVKPTMEPIPSSIGGPQSLNDLKAEASVRSQYRNIRECLVQDELFSPEDGDVWRLACRPFPLSKEQAVFFEELGPYLLAFYRGLNRLYLNSVKGREPRWIQEYLDLGKPPDLLAFGRMNRFKDHIPGVIRPDLILTETGMALTELDSVPGGMGLTGSLSRAYATQGHEIWPTVDGLVKSFSGMLSSLLQGQPPSLAIVVSDEAEAYRSEMRWLAARLCEEGWEASCVHPKDIRFTEDGLFIKQGQGERPVTVVYRFFELFDLKNIPKSELIMYSVKKGKVLITPPYKPWMEEKSAMALFHHPLLEAYWEQALTPQGQDFLRRIIPQTWILDPRPLPPSGVIPGLLRNRRAVADWSWLGEASQKERQFVVKVSGFSEQAWGSRGVVIGHDLPQQRWRDSLTQALEAFETSPSILQVFHKGRVVVVEYHDAVTGDSVPMEGRVRLSPYYCVVNGQAELGGVLATVCPKNKKIIHGMRDAVMVPCLVA
jgi:hypothetical protein